MPAPVRRTSIAARSAASSSSEATSMPSREACASCAVKRSSPIRSRRSRGERKRTRSRAPSAAPSSAQRVAGHHARVERRAAAREPRELGRRDRARRAGAPVAAALPQDPHRLLVAGLRPSARARAPTPARPPPPAAHAGSKPSARAPIFAASQRGAEREQRGAVAEVQQRGPRRVDPRADDVRRAPRSATAACCRRRAPSSRTRRRSAPPRASATRRRRRHPGRRPAPGRAAPARSGRRGQRRLAPVGGQLVEIGVEAPRRRELAERDPPHGVGHHRAAERDVGRELRPRRDALLDLDHRRRRAVA